MSIFQPIKKENPLSFKQKMTKLVIWWVLIVGTLFLLLPKLRTQIVNLQSPEVLLQPSCNLSKLTEGDVVIWRGKNASIIEVDNWASLNSIHFKLSK